jgi:hypothetical protein
MLPYTLEGDWLPRPGELFAIQPRERLFPRPKPALAIVTTASNVRRL